MFKNLTDRLTATFNKITGGGRLTKDNIREALKEVRTALLEADVALPVVKQFIEDVGKAAVGQEILKSLKPGQVLIKIVHDELVKMMGETCSELNLKAEPPVVVLMAGLQGSGKTTTSAKLAKWLKERQKKNVMLVSTDVYRPAAITQLETLAKSIDVDCFPSTANEKPEDIVKAALTAARKQAKDVLIIDTAGRLHVDAEMMGEIKRLHKLAEPTETLFVVDSMTGQDAANTAKAFHDALALTGVILTKTDGDARGGAALSIRAITGKPIKFIGVGEKIEGLEAFYPDRIASRILGMGDILSLVEEAEQKIDKTQAEKLAKKLKKAQFDLEDFLAQLKQMEKMGGMQSILTKLPGMSQLPEHLRNQVDDKKFKRIEAIILSMTIQERRFPDIIRASRKQRIAKGAGVDVPEVNRMLKQFEQMQKMVKTMAKKGGMMKMMKNVQSMMSGGGGFPM